MKLSLIIPTYNESKNIGRLLSKLSIVLKKYNIEIIVVDDGDDGTDIVVKNFRPKENFKIKLVKRKSKQGLSSAILLGFSNATGDILGVMDADFSHDPKSI